MDGPLLKTNASCDTALSDYYLVLPEVWPCMRWFQGEYYAAGPFSSNFRSDLHVIGWWYRGAQTTLPRDNVPQSLPRQCFWGDDERIRTSLGLSWIFVLPLELPSTVVGYRVPILGKSRLIVRDQPKCKWLLFFLSPFYYGKVQRKRSVGNRLALRS